MIQGAYGHLLRAAQKGPGQSDWLDEPVSRRVFLIDWLMIVGDCSPLLVPEAVATTAIEHPEWDMDETKTRREWILGEVAA